MKKFGILLAALLLILMLPVTVLAEGETEPTAQADSVTSLMVDNVHVFDGMDKAYKDGYLPTVKDGKATIVLPLISSGEIKDNTISVTPDLGDTASSPFVYGNYQRTISRQDNPVVGGAKVSSFLVRFDFSLVSSRYNGVYSCHHQRAGASGGRHSDTAGLYDVCHYHGWQGPERCPAYH